MRIAATADLHFSPERYAKLKDQLERVRDEADIFVLAGDLTNYGQPSEMEPLLNVLVRLRLMRRLSWSGRCLNCALRSGWSCCTTRPSLRQFRENRRRFIPFLEHPAWPRSWTGMERILWSMGTHITELLTDAPQPECPCTMWQLLFCKRSSLPGCIEYL